MIAASITASVIKDTAAKKTALMDWYKRNKVKVNKKGEITQNGQVLHQCDYLYDPDLDWTYHKTRPNVRIHYKNGWGGTDYKDVSVEEIMQDFGMIIGDPGNFQNPVVLYKNNDYLDTTPGNMEWCDASDQRYIDFQKVAHDRKMEKDHQSNCRLSEQSWKTIYGPDEPYQDWSDRPEKKGLCFG